MNVVEILGTKAALSINKYLNKDDIEFEKLKYGLMVLFINITKIIIIFVTAYFFNILRYTFVFFICFATIRSFAFGVHADSSFKCTLCNFIVFIGGPFLSLYIRLNNYLVLTIFTISIILLTLYAPADTKARPLTNKILRKKLKVKSLITASIFMMTALIIPSNLYKSIITFAIFSQSLCITPFIYKLFGKEYRNYEKINNK